MPSSESQAALIRSTYAKAGLDITKESDRPQFFEAHGTGTSRYSQPHEVRPMQQC
jgi:hybrid polyketide synthase/nonribosomal peptide synthetase ACE1